jgi:hypothetical protein
MLINTTPLVDDMSDTIGDASNPVKEAIENDLYQDPLQVILHCVHQK